MSYKHLSYITGEQLIQEIDFLLDKAKEAEEVAKTDFHKNVIDPFSALFEVVGFKLDYKTWYKNELVRKAQKTLSNHIGGFHQNILGHVSSWENLDVGQQVDLVCHERKIIAELKNKYNTVTGGKLSESYRELDDLIMSKASKYFGYTAYFVTIIPKNPQKFDKPFTPSNKKRGSKEATNEKIRIIDGASFYELVTGKPDALEQLYDAILNILNDKNLSDGTNCKLKKIFLIAFR